MQLGHNPRGRDDEIIMIPIRIKEGEFNSPDSRLRSIRFESNAETFPILTHISDTNRTTPYTRKRSGADPKLFEKVLLDHL